MRRLAQALIRWWTKPILPAPRGRAAVYLLAGNAALALLISSYVMHDGDGASPLSLATTLPYSPALASLEVPGEPRLDLASLDVPRPFELRRGQTLAGALRDLGLDRRDTYEAVEAVKEHLDVRRLRPNDDGAAYFDDGGRLTRLRLAVPGKGRLELVRGAAGWTSDWRESVRTVSLQHVEGELRDSLIAAIRQAGGEPAVAYKMSDVLQWDLDFHRDLRLGDRFEVLYEDVRLDGAPAGPGAVLALRYENRGQVYEAYRFGDDGFYYDAEGKPLRKMFLRSPLPFSRVTSRFSHRRFHPVLKVHRPHYGVDYGAPTGTPVRVTASGTVTFAGRTQQAGKMVKVSHPNGYLTAYLHLSGYGPGIRRGVRVRQEQVIGYVGSTGLATGPHLDYRVQKNGRWINPLGLPNTPAEPIAADQMAAFRAQRDELRARLMGRAPAARSAVGP